MFSHGPDGPLGLLGLGGFGKATAATSTGITTTVATSGSSSTPVLTQGYPPPINGICSAILIPNNPDNLSNGGARLMHLDDGFWHVTSPGDTCAAISTADPMNIMKTQKIFVGPFVFDPIATSKNGSQCSDAVITKMTSPAQMPAKWVDWFHTITNTPPATTPPIVYVAGVSKTDPRYLLDPNEPQDYLCSSITDGGAADGSQGTEICGAPAECPCVGPSNPVAACSAAKTPSGEQVYAVCGTPSYSRALNPGVSAAIPLGTVFTPTHDPSGDPATLVQYVGDPNQYMFYQYGDWLSTFALPMSSGTVGATNGGFYGPTDLLGTAVPPGLAGLFAQFCDDQNAQQAYINNPPIAQFIHPITGDSWGLWLAFTQDIYDVAPGAWNSSTDTPNGVHLEIGFAPIPSAPWYKDILEVIFFIPAVIFDVIIDVGEAAVGLTCDIFNDVTGQTQARVAATSPAAAAAVLALKKTCPPPAPPLTTSLCLQPQYMALPGCAPTPPVLPWYQQWWGIAGLVVVGLGLLSAVFGASSSASSDSK